MATKDDEFQRALASTLRVMRRACTLCGPLLDAEVEHAELNAARAAMGRAVLAHCKRTGCGIRVFERALVDGDLEKEALFLVLLDIADAVREFIQDEQSTEMIRIQASSLVRKAIRLARDWCRSNGLQPSEVDSRLSSTAFANR